MRGLKETDKGYRLKIPVLEGHGEELVKQLFHIQEQLEYDLQEQKLKKEGFVTLITHQRIGRILYDGTTDEYYEVPYQWLKEKMKKEGVKTGTVAEYAFKKRGSIELYQEALEEQVIKK